VSGARVDMQRLQELVRLHRMGTRCREVARLLEMGPAAELAYREILEAAGLLLGSPDELPPLDVLRCAVEAARPPKKGHQEQSTAQPWAVEIECARPSAPSPHSGAPKPPNAPLRSSAKSIPATRHPSPTNHARQTPTNVASR
jgi:hypothetical protein